MGVAAHTAATVPQVRVAAYTAATVPQVRVAAHTAATVPQVGLAAHTAATVPQAATQDGWAEVASVLQAAVGFAWPLVVLIAFFVFKDDLKRLIRILRIRLSSGDQLKFGSFEIERSRVVPGAKTSVAAGIYVNESLFPVLNRMREEQYSECRNVMIVHRIFKSSKPRQLYDLEVYCVPHKEATLASVKSVTYCFGRHGWDGKTFRSESRSSGFAVTTAAYGPLLCVAQVEFNDGKHADISRYLDFEMGTFAIAAERPDVH